MQNSNWFITESYVRLGKNNYLTDKDGIGQVASSDTTEFFTCHVFDLLDFYITGCSDAYDISTEKVLDKLIDNMEIGRKTVAGVQKDSINFLKVYKKLIHLLYKKHGFLDQYIGLLDFAKNYKVIMDSSIYYTFWVDLFDVDRNQDQLKSEFEFLRTIGFSNVITSDDCCLIGFDCKNTAKEFIKLHRGSLIDLGKV